MSRKEQQVSRQDYDTKERCMFEKPGFMFAPDAKLQYRGECTKGLEDEISELMIC